MTQGMLGSTTCAGGRGAVPAQMHRPRSHVQASTLPQVAAPIQDGRWSVRARTSTPARAPRPRGADDGSGTVLSAIILLALAVTTAVAFVALGWLGCVHQARATADLAALAGANARVAGGDPCLVATGTAARNGGRVVSCAVEGGFRSFVVRVEVGVALRPRVTGAPQAVSAVAAAGPIG